MLFYSIVYSKLLGNTGQLQYVVQFVCKGYKIMTIGGIGVKYYIRLILVPSYNVQYLMVRNKCLLR